MYDFIDGPRSLNCAFSGSGHYLWSGWGLKRKCYMPSKQVCPTICLSQIFLTPPKKNNKTRGHLCLNMVYVFTLSLWSKIILLPHLTQFFSVTPSFYLQSPPMSQIMTTPLAKVMNSRALYVSFIRNPGQGVVGKVS